MQVNQFVAGQIFAPLLPASERKTLAYILHRDGDELVVAECGQTHRVKIELNQAFGGEFAQVHGCTEDFILSAPCALSGDGLKRARREICDRAPRFARGGV